MERSTAILERLLTLHPKTIDLSLERVERLMAALGHPERRLPPVIHIAGTNGKGSTTAFMRAMLEAAGRSVHVYTSPHLVRFHERIRLGAAGGGRFVDEDALAEALLDVERINAGAPITQFEITTAAALRLFADHPADVALIEVGLGGRLDATNVIDAPLASVITPISFDHEKFLGATLPEIAAEKAGIVKRGRPVVSAPQPEAVAAVIEARAARLGAPLILGNRDFVAHAERGRLVYQDEQGLLDLPPPRLIGRHQFTNAGTAVAALRHAGLGLPAEAVETGLVAVEWPARMQRLSTGRLAERAGPIELWLDGGHNPGAGAVIAEAMADLEERVPRPLVLIAGMLVTKDPVGFFRPFAGLAGRVYTVPVEGSDAGRDPAELAEAARAAGLPAEPVEDVAAAIDRVRAAAGDGTAPRVLICGSLYLAGTVLAQNGTPPR
ncbi:bifunctional folylpolyglutamate synthase/dihydrofolate synthase [Prosthecomicrobium pneumaticum]|uniref:Dihydrofolate synthase/folylpolyglutamate synthase n=1 Tax=Prosthecomicrobium pneumaticum TaxID=81895 RepID=A0A7W9FNG7_9HYPH|nr:folylpolyglutamate synthase/dihydrofolate synthase family protein [Prosthecomicrobium pneumaticum]MBB5753887.1 dihydrofolate synthase/folylpolyglutamate synthase [Prosthecomicrobium pneumaticum]